MKRRVRKMSMVTRCILVTIGIYTLLLLINLGSFVLMGVRKGLMDTENVKREELQQISANLNLQDGTYLLPKQIQKELSQKNRFVLLLNESGTVIYDYQMPKDMKKSYTISEIATMSRYYYQDYPIYVWEHAAGLLVVGCQKGSIWKYSVDISIYRMKWMLHWLGDAVIINSILVLLICLTIGTFMQRKSVRRDRRDVARANWIAGISHDVRTPLAVILGYAADLIEEPLSKEQKNAARIIKKQALHLRELVSNLNLAMKLDYDMQPMQKHSILLAKWLRNLVSDYTNDNLEPPYELNLYIEKDTEPLFVKADAFLMERLFSNLLNNAVEHNPNGCQIEMELKKEAGFAVVFVRDSGGGNLNEAILKRLNKQTKQRLLGIKIRQKDHFRDEKLVREHGLGLKIVKNTANVHNWEIVGQNLSPNGWEVQLRIPATLSKT